MALGCEWYCTTETRALLGIFVRLPDMARGCVALCHATICQRPPAHETVKINPSQYITLTNNDIFGSYENVIDFVGVQYGTIRDNRLHDADDWCIYLKGGSAYFVIERNVIYNCGTGSFTAGQGTGFEFMRAPWLQYEAYDIKFVNNLVHDTEA